MAGSKPPTQGSGGEKAADPGRSRESVAADGGTVVSSQGASAPSDEERKAEAAAGERVAEESFGRQPRAGTQNTMANTGDEAAKGPSDSDLQKAAEERDKAMAVRRGADPDDVENYHENVLWLMDNLAHDRVALHERDPLHPGGEVFFAAGVPRRAYLTPKVQQMIQSGELMPVPEPKRTIQVWDDEQQSEVTIANPAYPDQDLPDPGQPWAAQPGRPIPLGRRNINSAYYDGDQVKAIKQRQAALPTYVPLAAGGIVPPEVAAENEEFMARQRASGRSPRR